MTSVDSASDYHSDLRFSHGRGAYCWTTNGTRYIDLICGQGPVILGHCNPRVDEAVVAQLKRGILLPGAGPIWDTLKERLRSLFPHHDAALPFKTGSEAVAAAIRLSRAVTGRLIILRVGFHGWHDDLVSPYVRCHSYDASTFTTSWPLGVAHHVHGPLIRTWYGDDASDLVDGIEELGGEVAAVLIDPVQLRRATADVGRRISQATRRAGALLIFDESKTGFRVDMRGAQHALSVNPDLTILSKGLANGLPLAVVLGSTEVVGLAGPARIKGTFGYEAVAMSAAVATIEELEQNDGPSVLNQRGTELLHGISRAIEESGWSGLIEAVPYQWPCLPFIRFMAPARPMRDRFFLGLRERGVLMLRDHMSYIPLALSSDDVQTIAAAAFEVLAETARESP